MRRDDFVAQRAPRWGELEQLLARAKRRPERLGPAGVLRLGDGYRAAAADLALARRRFPGDPIVDELTSLVGRARPVVYERDRKRESFAHYVTTGLWQRVRERPVFLVIAAVLLLGVWVLAGIWSYRDPVAASAVAPQFTEIAELTPDERAAFSSQLFTNNIRVAFLAFAGGITAGLGTALLLVFNGFFLGSVTGVTIEGGNGRALLEWIPAHGFLEISLIIVAGAAGLRMGWALVSPGNRTRGVALVAEARPAAEMALGAGAWLVLAGLLEGFVSPSGIGLLERMTVGLVAAGSFWVLVLWRGAPQSAPDRSGSRPVSMPTGTSE